ncbi:MAG TPA: family 1 glycosylhydrolase [Streptosporangiaceae bacterium]|nr:family 1 glycosylhydrolase [Streptosporangiaceae bacterium]
MPRFPDGFAWGVSTAAYQIEGATGEDGRGVSVWDTFCRKPGAIRDGQTGDVACDHYHRWPEDVALMERLGVNAYRFSIGWPRIQPDGAGPALTAGLDFYDRLTDKLLAGGIAPVPTLFHWDLPQALEDAGGWLARDTAYRFADYAALVAGRLADRIGMFITLNEPFVVTSLGYALGVHAPGRTLLAGALPTAHHQLLGHGLAAAALRAAGVRQVAIANNCAPVWPASGRAADLTAADAYDTLHNRLFNDPLLLGSYPDLSAFGVGADGLDSVQPGDLELISAPLDALGINYYTPSRISAPAHAAPSRDAASPDAAPQPATAPPRPAGAALPFQLEPIPGYPLTAFGWPVVPTGLTELLTTFRDRYADRLPPVYITENGCSVADEPDAAGVIDDQPRIRYLDSHIRAVADAITAGVDVRGYLTWSLLDNFEWAEGYHQRFGLVHVDFETQRRTPKASFGWYQDLIASQRAAHA